MSSRHHIDDFMRDRIIGKIEEGRKITDVARDFDIAHSVVSRLWWTVRGGRVRSTTPAEDEIYRPISKRNRRYHSSTGGKSVSCCLRKADLPKNCCQTFEEEDYTHTRPVCISIDQITPCARLQVMVS
ncbi:hypothetical protein TNCV_636821 [Trichonephila clavipes]|nr:hypothetical protein TNCV_636821 [Trichonephila clavipes]